MKKLKIKTIDINALEWFDKTYGNSYFAATVSINYGTESAQSFAIPFQYGYGDHYRDVAKRELVKRGFITCANNERLSQYCEDNKIILRHSKRENCKQRELKNIA